jgi:hypothetical protein
MTTIAWINNQTNICDNVSGDIRPVSEISKEGYQLIDLDQTLTVDWSWNGTEWVMEDRNFGEGGIGDSYENGKLIKPKPADPPVQPETTGTQEL